MLRIGLNYHSVFGKICFTICRFNISTECSLSSYEYEKTFMVIPIGVATKSIAPVDRVSSRFNYFICRNKLSTLEFGSHLPQLTLFPSKCDFTVCLDFKSFQTQTQ